MAAELAFSVPPPPGNDPIQPLVIVRRSRVVSPAPGLETLIEGTTSAPSAGTASKAPRVFLVESQEHPMPVSASIGDAQAPGLADHQSEVEQPPAARPQHRRRRRQDNRPGAVVHVVPSPPTKARSAPSTPNAQAPGPAVSARDLAVALASFEPILDAIRRAAAFRVTDDDAADEWVSLSERVAELQASLGQMRG